MAAIEFKEFGTVVTWAIFEDAEKWDFLVMGVASKILEYGCSALNARTNLTLYMGVNDNGLVTGIKFESYELVSENVL